MATLLEAVTSYGRGYSSWKDIYPFLGRSALRDQLLDEKPFWIGSTEDEYEDFIDELSHPFIAEDLQISRSDFKQMSQMGFPVEITNEALCLFVSASNHLISHLQKYNQVISYRSTTDKGRIGVNPFLYLGKDYIVTDLHQSRIQHRELCPLFYKRLCDVWEEEYEDRLAKYKDKGMAADPDEHRFHIPEGQFWKDVRKHTTDIGAKLNAAFHTIEDANMRLKDVFQDVDFNNKQRFPDEMLEKLLRHFEKTRLRREDVDGDMLGAAYEYGSMVN